MNMYQPTSETASPYPEGATTFYDFRKDFDAIARPAMLRYLKHLGYDPDEPSDGFDDCGDAARSYATSLWTALRRAGEYIEDELSAPLHPDIRSWSRESAVAITNARLERLLAPAPVDEPEEPIDVYEAVYFGTQMARERGYACDPEAVTFAADRLKSKIERDAVENAEVCVYDGIRVYHQCMRPKAERRLAEGRGDGKVVYVDWRKRAAQKAAQKQAEARQEQPKREQPKGDLKFEWLDDIEESNRDWLVWGLIGKREMSAWYGEPSAGKSILVGDLAFHIAHGLPWMGMDVVKTPVAYFAAERAGLVGRRLQGLKSHLKVNGKSDLSVISGALDIRKPRDTAIFIAGIKRAGDQAGAPIGLVVIDTYSRALGGGDENGPLDGGAAVANIQKIIDATGGHVLIVHHVGNADDAKGRLRGWSGLNGAIDTSVLVKQPKKDGVVIWMVQKENDPLGGERLPPHKVKIRSHKTGAVDAKGNAVTAPYLELLRAGKGEGAQDDSEDGDQPFTFREPGELAPPKPFEKRALVALAKAIKTHGFVAADDTVGFPDDVPTVSVAQWRDAYEALSTNDSPDGRRKAFNYALKAMTENGRVATCGDRVWPSLIGQHC
jgi:AAA domain